MSGRLVGWTREPSRAKQTPTTASLPSLSVVSWPGTDVCQAGDEFATAGMHRDETLEWIAWIRDFLGFLILRQCNAFGVPHGTERDHITSREEVVGMWIGAQKPEVRCCNIGLLDVAQDRGRFTDSDIWFSSMALRKMRNSKLAKLTISGPVGWT